MDTDADTIVRNVIHDLEMMYTMDNMCAIKDSINELIEELEELKDA